MQILDFSKSQDKITYPEHLLLIILPEVNWVSLVYAYEETPTSAV